MLIKGAKGIVWIRPALGFEMRVAAGLPNELIQAAVGVGRALEPFKSWVVGAADFVARREELDSIGRYGVVRHEDVDISLGKRGAKTTFLKHGDEIGVGLTVDGLEVDMDKVALGPGAATKGPLVAVFVLLHTVAAVVNGVVFFICRDEITTAGDAVLEGFHRRQLAEVSGDNDLRELSIIPIPL
jgi:hypothetical protein